MDVVEAALDLSRRAAARTPTVNLVLPSVFQAEWDDHIKPVNEEVERFVEQQHRTYAGFQSLHDQLFEAALDLPDLRQYKYGTVLTRLCDELISRSRAVQPDDEIALRAMRRAMAHLAPARKGKAEPKDCLAFEEALALGRRLRQRGYAHPYVFVSSNTADFGTTTAPHAPIKQDLDAISGSFTTTLSHAAHLARESRADE